MPVENQFQYIAFNKIWKITSFQTKKFWRIRHLRRYLIFAYASLHSCIQNRTKVCRRRCVRGVNQIEWHHKYIHKLSLFLLRTINVWHSLASRTCFATHFEWLRFVATFRFFIFQEERRERKKKQWTENHIFRVWTNLRIASDKNTFHPLFCNDTLMCVSVWQEHLVNAIGSGSPINKWMKHLWR